MTSEPSNVRFIQGNEAIAEGALYAGLRFYAGYPITPSTEIAEILSIRLPDAGGKFIQMEDEVASLCTIIGASLTGLKVMTATSGPGDGRRSRIPVHHYRRVFDRTQGYDRHQRPRFFFDAGGHRICSHG